MKKDQKNRKRVVVRRMSTIVLGCVLKHQPICLRQKAANISGKVSGPAAAAVGSAQTRIWPYSSLYFFPKPTIPPPQSTVSGKLGGFNQCTYDCRSKFPSSPLATQPPVLSFDLTSLPL